MHFSPQLLCIHTKQALSPPRLWCSVSWFRLTSWRPYKLYEQWSGGFHVLTTSVSLCPTPSWWHTRSHPTSTLSVYAPDSWLNESINKHNLTYTICDGKLKLYYHLLLLCCLPTPMTLASGGESDVPACGLPDSFSVHLASSAVTPARSVHKSRGDNVVRRRA